MNFANISSIPVTSELTFYRVVMPSSPCIFCPLCMYCSSLLVYHCWRHPKRPTIFINSWFVIIHRIGMTMIVTQTAPVFSEFNIVRSWVRWWVQTLLRTWEQILCLRENLNDFCSDIYLEIGNWETKHYINKTISINSEQFQIFWIKSLQNNIEMQFIYISQFSKKKLHQK